MTHFCSKVPKNSSRRELRSPFSTFLRHDPYWSFISAQRRQTENICEQRKLKLTLSGVKGARKKKKGCRVSRSSRRWSPFSGNDFVCGRYNFTRPATSPRKNSRAAYRRYLHIQHPHSLSRLLPAPKVLSLFVPLAPLLTIPRSSCFNFLIPNLGCKRTLCNIGIRLKVHSRKETIRQIKLQGSLLYLCLSAP